MTIHATAIIHKDAKIDPSAEIGPFVVVGPNVEIGANCKVGPHADVKHTRLGARSIIGTGAVIGGDPQVRGWKPVPSMVEIGSDTLINEQVFIHRSMYENGKTVVGDRCMIMSSSHLAHDCVFGNDVSMVSLSAAAGHTVVGDFAFISGLVGIHQFVRIGSHVMIGGVCRITRDVVPFMLVEGSPVTVKNINGVGLKRRGFSQESISAIRAAYRILFRSGYSKTTALSELEKLPDATGEIKKIVAFIASSKRGITGGRRSGAAVESTDS